MAPQRKPLELHMNKGALHRELGVPEGNTIPESKLDSAANSSNPKLKRRATFAKTMAGWNHSGQ